MNPAELDIVEPCGAHQFLVQHSMSPFHGPFGAQPSVLDLRSIQFQLHLMLDVGHHLNPASNSHSSQGWVNNSSSCPILDLLCCYSFIFNEPIALIIAELALDFLRLEFEMKYCEPSQFISTAQPINSHSFHLNVTPQDPNPWPTPFKSWGHSQTHLKIILTSSFGSRILNSNFISCGSSPQRFNHQITPLSDPLTKCYPLNWTHHPLRGFQIKVKVIDHHFTTQPQFLNSQPIYHPSSTAQPNSRPTPPPSPISHPSTLVGPTALNHQLPPHSFGLVRTRS